MLEQQAELALDNVEKTAVIVSCTYLLSIVFPRIPSPVLKLKFNRVAAILAKTLDMFKDGEAALVKYVKKS
jgi:hypothetical protein